MNRLAAQIIRAALLVGTLDIFAAFVYYYAKVGNGKVWNILYYIASAAFGKDAVKGAPVMLYAGLLFHYFIAAVFTVILFLLAPYIKMLKTNTVLVGVIYGLLVWTVMNLIVVPFSKLGWRPFNLSNALINMGILVLCIGIPLSILAKRYFNKNVPVNVVAL
jgi:hypothetical protein